jgi:hypothetical protein
MVVFHLAYKDSVVEETSQLLFHYDVRQNRSISSAVTQVVSRMGCLLTLMLKDEKSKIQTVVDNFLYCLDLEFDERLLAFQIAVVESALV